MGRTGVRTGRVVVRPVRAGTVSGLVEHAVGRCRDLASTSALPPFVSLAHGAAGVAYFLLREAGFGGGEPSFQAAGVWAARAERAAAEPGAFTLPGESTSSVLDRSLLYGSPGVWWVVALVAAAAHDRAGVRRSAAAFAELAGAAVGTPGDVAHGSAGLLLGCAQLIESFEDHVAIAPVRTVGGRLAAELAALADREGALAGETTFGYLGAAHGWGGIAHALLRWSRAISEPPAPEALTLLDRLIGLRRASGRWPVRAGSRDVYRSWCHGGAGWAQLWALAWEVTRDDRLLHFAEFCAEDALDADENEPSLCCGRAGHGFAALTLYRATGERRWLTAAKRAASDAAHSCVPNDVAPDSLFNGDLGPALLAAELEDPARAAMPVYQPLV